MSTSNTPNYGWVIPGDDENIRDGADAIRSLGTDVDRDLKALANQKPDLSSYQTVSAHTTAMAGKATVAQLNNMVFANGSGGRWVRSGSTVVPSLGPFHNFTFTATGLTTVEAAVLTNGDYVAAQGIAVVFSISGERGDWGSGVPDWREYRGPRSSDQLGGGGNVKSRTPNYRWLVPDADEWLHDGAEEIRDLGTDIDAEMSRFAWPSTSHLLTAAKSNADLATLASTAQVNAALPRQIAAGVFTYSGYSHTGSFSVPVWASSVVMTANGQVTSSTAGTHHDWGYPVARSVVSGNTCQYEIAMRNWNVFPIGALLNYSFYWLAA